MPLQSTSPELSDESVQRILSQQLCELAIQRSPPQRNSPGGARWGYAIGPA
jgi:hypothetical protein